MSSQYLRIEKGRRQRAGKKAGELLRRAGRACRFYRGEGALKSPRLVVELLTSISENGCIGSLKQKNSHLPGAAFKHLETALI